MKFIQSSRGTRVIFHAPIAVRSAGAFCTTITIVEDMSYPGESINYWKAKLDNNFGYCEIRDTQCQFHMGDTLEGSLHLGKTNFIHIKVP